MQETKGKCCDLCETSHANPLQYCTNADCPCHNSSDRNKKVAEALADLAATSRKQGANEFKQKVLEALPKLILLEEVARLNAGGLTPLTEYAYHNSEGWHECFNTIRTIISNLEV